MILLAIPILLYGFVQSEEVAGTVLLPVDTELGDVDTISSERVSCQNPSKSTYSLLHAPRKSFSDFQKLVLAKVVSGNLSNSHPVNPKDVKAIRINIFFIVLPYFRKLCLHRTPMFGKMDNSYGQHYCQPQGQIPSTNQNVPKRHYL